MASFEIRCIGATDVGTPGSPGGKTCSEVADNIAAKMANGGHKITVAQRDGFPLKVKRL